MKRRRQCQPFVFAFSAQQHILAVLDATHLDRVAQHVQTIVACVAFAATTRCMSAQLHSGRLASTILKMCCRMAFAARHRLDVLCNFIQVGLQGPHELFCLRCIGSITSCGCLCDSISIECHRQFQTFVSYFISLAGATLGMSMTFHLDAAA